MAQTAAERQARFREKRDAELQAYRESVRPGVEAIISALDRGWCSRFAKGLPEDPVEALDELARRLEGKWLIACDPMKRKRARKRE